MKNFLKYLPLAAMLAFASPAFAQISPSSNMLCPSPFATYVGEGGKTFTANAQGQILAVGGRDVNDMQALGCKTYGATYVSANADPTTSNDNTQGFVIGSLWVDSTGPKSWIATSVGTGTALWEQYAIGTTQSTVITAGASGTAGSFVLYPATAAYGYLTLTNTGNVGAYNTILNLAAQGQASTITIPDPGAATASLVETKGTQTISGNLTLSGANSVTGAMTFTNSDLIELGSSTGYTTITSANAGASNYTLTLPAVTDTVATLGTAQSFTAAETIGTGGSLVAKVSGVTTDLNPAFSTTILGNPVSKTTVGTCTVASVNAGTCIPLVGVSGRTISVTNFDIVATGSAATCTGVLLEDTNSAPVVIATLAAGTLTNLAHNLPLTATLGVGFGGGSGLTTAKGVQIIVNGSNCTTTTAFGYAITYTVQ